MSHCCSLLVLCVGGVAALTAIAAVAIATNTDHWTHISVVREAVRERGMETSSGQEYFTRAVGLFRVCFPDKERPEVGSPGLFLNGVEDWCYERDYKFVELIRGQLRPENISHWAEVQLHLKRTAPCLLVVYLFLMVLTGIIGLSGCWSQSSNKLITTAALQLFAALVGACAMASWHAALFLEMEKVHDEGFPLTWPLWLQEASQVGVGWSYFVAWAGMCLTLVASLATSASAICLRAERRQWDEHTQRMKLKVNSMMAINRYYPGETAAKSVKSISPPPIYPPGYVSGQEAMMGPLGGAPYPLMTSRPRSQSRGSLYSSVSRENLAEHAPDLNTFVDYKKVVGQLENSKFY